MFSASNNQLERGSARDPRDEALGWTNGPMAFTYFSATVYAATSHLHISLTVSKLVPAVPLGEMMPKSHNTSCHPVDAQQLRIRIFHSQSAVNTEQHI
jgi:hypothetical protein